MEVSALLVSILAWTAPVTLWLEFSFCWTKVAAQKNLEILALRGYDMNLEVALQAQPYSSLSIGSEFHPTDILKPMCGIHPLWPRVEQWLQTGVDYPLEPILEGDWLTDLHANFECGNHQLATYNFDWLVSMLTEEVQQGWQLILPQQVALELWNAVLALLGLVDQDSINEFGEIIPKWHMIHNQSFNVIKGTLCLVNDCLHTADLTPCWYIVSTGVPCSIT